MIEDEKTWSRRGNSKRRYSKRIFHGTALFYLSPNPCDRAAIHPPRKLESKQRKRRTKSVMLLNKFTLVGIAISALSMSAIFTFHPKIDNRHYLSTWSLEEPIALSSTSSYDHHPNIVKIQRARIRQNRTRPPQTIQSGLQIIDQEGIGNDYTNGTYQLWFSHSKGVMEQNPIKLKEKEKNIDSSLVWCGYEAQEAAKANFNFYPSQLILSNQSRVVITNVLSSIGMHLAIHLAKQCKVSKILGIDEIMPNTRRNRMKEMERYAQLKMEIPGFQKLLIPFSGVLPKLEIDAQRLRAFAPTHIVHFSLEEEEVEESQLYPIRQKLQAMDQLLQFMKDTMGNRPKPHLLYAGSNLCLEQILANSYQNLYNISSIGLQLPATYGPWEKEGSWPRTLADMVVNSQNESVANVAKKSFLYVEDAISAIISSMQMQRFGTLIRLSSGTTSASLTSAMKKGIESASTKMTSNNKKHWQKLINWMPKTNPQIGLQKLLSWYYTYTFPYGETPQRQLPSYVKENYHYQFPCASECSIPGFCYRTSYDNIIPLTKKITSKCKIAIYMVNLAIGIESLPPAVSLPTNDSFSNYLCNIAFVSSSSHLAAQNNVNNGWSIITVPANTSSMTEAELLLPKLSPGKFFSDSVSKAMFVEPSEKNLPDGDTIIAMSEAVDAPARKGKWVYVQNPGISVAKMKWRPKSRARLTMLLINKKLFPFNVEEAPLLKIAKQMTKNIAAKELQLQLKFYEHASHLVLTHERRRFYESQPPSYKKIPFIFLQSTLLYYDLTENESRILRCEWYDEQSFWGANGMEELSLAFILGKRRVQGRHGPKNGNAWVPLMQPSRIEDEGENIINEENKELFFRIISP